MPTIPLPQDPDLGQLRHQARELQRAVLAGDQDALALVAEFHPDLTGRSGASSGADPLHPSTTNRASTAALDQVASTFPLSAAQLVIARRYGFPSWPRLRRHVEIVTARSWTPGIQPPVTEPLAGKFLRLACLTYSDDEYSDRIAAARLFAEHPELPTLSLPVAAACADVVQVRRFLAADASLATAIAGPHGWSPLLYQAYARHDPQVGLDATIQTARLLLDAGADPNDGRFWHGLPTPFTVLTGVLGYGSGSPRGRH